MSFLKNVSTNIKINKLRKEILEVEQKRSRSQAALVQSILSHNEPRNEDVEFFNQYTEQIDKLRDEMQQLQQLV